ncbi:MAG: hypothetical protein HZB92_07990 [Euryarchaeota archaeon]|nr:hypothetical protein [Euryarchaeota archaeon]
MRYVKISRDEAQKIAKLHEGALGKSYRDLLFSEGTIIGKEIARIADRERFFETAAKLVAGRGWTDEIVFEKGRAIATGSFDAGERGCERLRGIVAALYENQSGKVDVQETECEGRGADNCVFIVKKR